MLYIVNVICFFFIDGNLGFDEVFGLFMVGFFDVLGQRFISL